jgi:hypothetical protein
MAATHLSSFNLQMDFNNDMYQPQFVETPDRVHASTVANSVEYLISPPDAVIGGSHPPNIEDGLEAARRASSETAAEYITERTPFRVNGFADKQMLAGYFPRIYDDENTSLRIRLSKRSLALLLQVGLIGAIFATNLFILVYASHEYPTRDGVGLLFAGDCDTVKTANRWLHLLINVLSTGMLSASSYCIQLQASPTRADVDRAHKMNKWLDIGAPSFRNLRYIGRWRLISCIVLAASSLPIHLV